MLRWINLRWNNALCLGLLLLSYCMPPSGAQVPEPQQRGRRTVGLALGGGSASGIAHAGVLAWLEEHRIPVDYVAGTSMGGLVAGAYATGMSAVEIRTLLEEQDWNTTLGPGTAYTDLTYRRKEDRRDYPSAIQFSLKKVGSPVGGINSAPRVALLLSRIGARVGPVDDFNRLPIPFRCVAVDLRSGDTVVLARGSLATALRATMAIPGVFTPVEREGRLLIDGGVADNVPADVARSLGADVVIAVDVGEEFARREQFDGIVGTLGRTYSILTRKSTQQGIAVADLVLRPDLRPYTGADWSAAPEMIKRGWAVAEENKDKLLPLALTEEQWQVYLAARRARLPAEPFVPQFVEVVGASSVPRTDALRHYLEPFIGHPLNTRALENALSVSSGNGYFASLIYVPVQENGRQGLRVIAQQNPNAPPTLIAALIISSDRPREVTTLLRARATLADVAIRNSETRLDFGAGSAQYYAAEYFAPFSGFLAQGQGQGRTQVFIAPRAYYSDTPQAIIERGTHTANYLVRSSGAGLDLGLITGRSSEMRFGWEQGHQVGNVLVGALESPRVSGGTRRLRFRYTYDGQDAPVLPRRGLRTIANVDRIYRAPGATSAYNRIEVASSWFTPFTPRSQADTVFLVGSAGTLTGSGYSPVSEFSLGGLMRLSAYQPGEFLGRHYYFATAGYLRQLNPGSFLLGGRTSLGTWLELGDTSGSRIVRTSSAYPVCLSGGLLVETLLGPMIVGASLGNGGHTRAFVSIGRFLY
jgi:NTE family protein